MNPENNFEQVLSDENKELPDSFSLEVLDKKDLSFEDVKEYLVRIENNSLTEGQKGLGEEDFEMAFENEDSIMITMKDGGRVIGFTIAEPVSSVYDEETYPGRDIVDDTAYITDTAFEKDYQNKGLVVPIMKELEKQLVEKGYGFIERDSMDEYPDKKNGTYADKIRKNYKDRIIKEEKVESEYGKQVYFKIKL